MILAEREDWYQVYDTIRIARYLSLGQSDAQEILTDDHHLFGKQTMGPCAIMLRREISCLRNGSESVGNTRRLSMQGTTWPSGNYA